MIGQEDLNSALKMTEPIAKNINLKMLQKALGMRLYRYIESILKLLQETSNGRLWVGW